MSERTSLHSYIPQRFESNPPYLSPPHLYKSILHLIFTTPSSPPSLLMSVSSSYLSLTTSSPPLPHPPPLFSLKIFTEAGVVSIEHADFDGIERLAAVTGGEIASTFDRPDLATLGECALIDEIMVSTRTYTVMYFFWVYVHVHCDELYYLYVYVHVHCDALYYLYVYSQRYLFTLLSFDRDLFLYRNSSLFLFIDEYSI